VRSVTARTVSRFVAVQATTGGVDARHVDFAHLDVSSLSRYRPVYPLKRRNGYNGIAEGYLVEWQNWVSSVAARPTDVTRRRRSMGPDCEHARALISLLICR
jgi:hypothetical protein